MGLARDEGEGPEGLRGPRMKQAIRLDTTGANIDIDPMVHTHVGRLVADAKRDSS